MEERNNMSIQALNEFVRKHSERGTCRCGQCDDHPGIDQQPNGHTVNLAFFEVSARDNPDKDEFVRLIKESKTGEFCDLDMFDGNEHGYMEIGGWIGDQGAALQFLGLGHLLGVWKLFTPAALGLSGDQALQMAGSGYVIALPNQKANA